MTYARSVLFSWSRRDRLAVLLIAITVAFLVGMTLVLVATSAETTSVAAQFDAVGEVDRYESFEAATNVAGPESVVLPVVTVDDGQPRHIVGVPSSQERPSWLVDLELATPPTDGIATTAPVADQVQLQGSNSTLTVPLHERSGGKVLPPYWGVADSTLVKRLGPTSALVLSPSSDGRATAHRTPLQASLGFFQEGSEQVVGALTLIGAGAALLVSVIVFGVVRMTARDRRRTIFVVRATGGTRRRILALFALRGALLAGAGVALGYALGVIATNLAVNVAVTVGLPTSLSARVTPTVAGLFGKAGLGIVALAAVTAPLAARPIANGLAGTKEEGGHRGRRNTEGIERGNQTLTRLRQWCSPRLIALRTIVPITLSLWTFVVIAVLLVAGATAAAPLSGDGATVVEPGAIHPVASTVPVAYADALEATGTQASPEILAFTVLEGDPAMVRGARFADFAAVSDASLVEGEAPSNPNEAVVGVDLAKSLDLKRGQTVTLGGSTTPAVTTVEIVGIYEAAGPYDDSFIVPLATARHLGNRSPETVHFIRTTGQAGRSTPSANSTVVSLSSPSTVPRGEQTRVTATLVNPGSKAHTQTVSLQVNGTTITRKQVTVPSLSTTQVSFAHSFADAGDHTIHVGTVERTVRVVPPETPQITGLPDPIPAGSQPVVRIQTVTGDPISNATITTGNRSYATDTDGSVRVTFSTTGTRTVTVTANDHEVQRTVTVAETESRTLAGSLAIQPTEPSMLTRPTARVTLVNPWNRTESPQVTLRTDRVVVNRTVTLDPGDRQTIERRLDRHGQGTYPVELAVDGEVAESVNVTVDGDGRLASALATTDATVPASGLGNGVATVLGNLTILAGTLAALAGALAIGSIAAGLAGAVHGRRQTVGIYRATGASPTRIARLIVGDALKLGLIATPAALVAGLGTLHLLAEFDRLVFFGVRIHPQPTVNTLVAVAGGAMVVVTLSGLAVTTGLLLATPARLLNGNTTIAGRDQKTDPGLEGESSD